MKKFLLGFLAGAITFMLIAWTMAPKMMLNERLSPYGTEKTVQTIQANAIKHGWVASDVISLHTSIKKYGGYELEPVYLVNLCNATHAYNILKKDKQKIISVMMPCTISVYEKSDGKTYIGTMNASLMGKMFGGDVAQIFGKDVAREQDMFIEFAK